ncbi:TPA: hypothetical protein PXP66_003531 [Yersinia enterocolitica]|nr:hypothetical protein [Yersinia enterocolitica]
MKKILLALMLLFSSCAFAGSELELNKVKLPEAISLIYSEVLKVPYMLDPQLVNDERMITFRLTPDIDEREFVTRYLGNMNIRIWTKKGVDFIAPYTPKEPVKPRYTWTYTPQYRSVAYLSDILGGYVSGSFNNSGAVISDDSLKGSSGASNYINPVEYRSSGVLFNVTPSIKSRTMDLKIQQQLSNFVTTETGVNNSPTLIKRDVTTEVSLADGDIILLGGLAEQKDSKASSGWSVFGSRTSESNKTDIMVMLQVRKVDRSRATPRSAARSGELFRDNLN